MARRRKGRAIDGVLLVDKPAGYSSNGLLQKVRWLYQAQKAGHTGALDPAATGLLPVCLGEATKFTQFLLDANKRYLTTGVLGVETDTLDAEGVVVSTATVPDVQFSEIDTLVKQRFTGDIEQVPPMYSALKRDGKKLYELAREGKHIELDSRPVTIFQNVLQSFETPQFTLDVSCSKGTYIRTLVADIGTALGCGAHVQSLRRTEHGKFNIADAVTLDALIAVQESGDLTQLDELLISIDELLSELTPVSLNDHQARFFSHGNDIAFEGVPGKARVYGGRGEFLGVGRLNAQGRLFPERLISRQEP